jgi:hypothetical protein
MRAYIKERKTIGRLTAEVSYLLIRPLFMNEHKDLYRFLQKVGEVGCLIDSAIDLRADVRLGLTSFSPTLKDYLQLVSHLLRDGARILLRHMRLLGLFLEAVMDNLLDFRFRPVSAPVWMRPVQASRCTPQCDKTGGAASRLVSLAPTRCES